MQHDFTEETLTITLSVPIEHSGIVAKKAVVRRLYAPDISKLKTMVASIPENLPKTLQYLMYAKEISNVGIDYFIDDKGQEIKEISNKILISKSAPANIHKAMIFITILVNERPYFTTAYRCWNCKKSTLCDLDPAEPIPKDLEEDRVLMENIMDFYHDKQNKKGETEFKYELLHPINIEYEGEKIPVYSFTSKFPSFETYEKAYKDSLRREAPDLWVIYDSLVRINDKSEEDTKMIKEAVGFEKLFRLKNADLQGIVSAQDVYGVEIRHSYTCKHCGENNATPFDMTNFFDYLRTR